MNLLWPWLLLLLLLIPLIIALYVWMLRRKRKYAVRYSSLSLIRAAQPERARWRQHLPFALFLLALVSLTTAMARPVAQVEVPLSRTTIILAMDISRSMCATDVAPNRLTVAQEAALAFIEDQAAGTQIGIVAFARFAAIVVPPTNDKEVLKEAVNNFTTSLGTAIGSAILKSLDAIAEVNPDVAPSGVNLQTEERAPEQDPLAATEEALAAAGYLPDIIVLLTDGANSDGPLPIEAAQQAADRRVRVYTIGFGTTEPGQMVCTRQQLGGDMFGGDFGSFGGGGGFGGGGFRRFLIIDEPTLQAVADLTGGSYFRAENADQLLEIFLELPNRFTLQNENREISVIFSTLGAMLATAAVALSLLWNRYP
jgi:Ca-activated chloride channel family protein